MLKKLATGLLAGALLLLVAELFFEMNFKTQTEEELFRTFVSAGLIAFNTILVVSIVDHYTRELAGPVFNVVLAPILAGVLAVILVCLELGVLMWALNIKSLFWEGVQRLLLAVLVSVSGAVFLVRFWGPCPGEQSVV